MALAKINFLELHEMARYLKESVLFNIVLCQSIQRTICQLQIYSNKNQEMLLLHFDFNIHFDFLKSIHIS